MYRDGTEGNSGWAREFVAESNLSTLYMKNNIFYGYGDQANISISSQSNASYDYNVNYQGGAQSQYQGANGTYANPQYVNPPSDMTLQSNSPGISMNAGAYADGGGPSASPPPTNTNAVPNPPSALAIN